MAYISTSDTVKAEDGINDRFAAPRFYCTIVDDPLGSGAVRVEVTVYDTVAATGSNPHRHNFVLEFTEAELDDFEATVATARATLRLAVEEAVKDYLETLNPTETFTIT